MYGQEKDQEEKLFKFAPPQTTTRWKRKILRARAHASDLESSSLLFFFLSFAPRV